MIPRDLNEWTLERLDSILRLRLDENTRIEFKQDFTTTKAGRQRLQRTCCAFANSDGGFLIYGICDDRSLFVDDRLVGLPPATDFAASFCNYPNRCVPQIDWDYKRLKPLANGNAIYVAYVPKSTCPPHVVANDVNGFDFLTRGMGTNDYMTFDQIRAAFQQSRNVVQRLNALALSLS